MASKVSCSRCGARREPIQMAKVWGEIVAYYCHGFTDAQPTCYMRASFSERQHPTIAEVASAAEER